MENKEQKMIYVVTSGEYSDYHIVSVFSTRDAAEKLVESFPADDDTRIEEYILNATNPQWAPGYKFYRVEMKKNGNSEVSSWDFNNDTEHGRYYILEQRTNGELSLHWHGFATSKQHAVKIVNELRVQLIAADKFKPEQTKSSYRSIDLIPGAFVLTDDMYRQMIDAKKIIE